MAKSRKKEKKERKERKTKDKIWTSHALRSAIIWKKMARVREDSTPPGER